MVSGTGHEPGPGRRAVVVGGTGMLAGATRWLLDEGWTVVSVARSQTGHAPLAAAAAEGRYIAVRIDWSRRAELEQALRAHGPYELALTWTHGDVRPIVRLVDGLLAAGAPHYVVRGSASADPGGDPLGPPWREIVLGWVGGRYGRRWLTNEEISAGVVECIRAGKGGTVGQTGAR